MAFCTNCGTQTDARFCTKCGQPVGQPPQAAPPPAFTPAAAPQAPAAPAPFPPAARKKTSPIVWILGAVVGVFVLIGVLIVGAGLFVAHKVKNAGFDSALAEKNPALAAAKVMVSLNPDVEIVNIDEDKGVMTIRDKKTGKSVTMNAEDIKNGKISFSDESTGEKVSFGSGGAITLPGWVPSYPGSKPEGTFSASGSGKEGGMAHFRTSDASSKVIAFYSEKLKSSGFTITSDTTEAGGAAQGGVLTAEENSDGRSLMITVGSGSEGTDVTLTYGTKK